MKSLYIEKCWKKITITVMWGHLIHEWWCGQYFLYFLWSAYYYSVRVNLENLFIVFVGLFFQKKNCVDFFEAFHRQLLTFHHYILLTFLTKLFETVGQYRMRQYCMILALPDIDQYRMKQSVNIEWQYHICLFRYWSTADEIIWNNRPISDETIPHDIDSPDIDQYQIKQSVNIEQNSITYYWRMRYIWWKYWSISDKPILYSFGASGLSIVGEPILDSTDSFNIGQYRMKQSVSIGQHCKWQHSFMDK